MFEFDGLDHEGYCIRPPSEGRSILFQATLGCSHNKCTFCEAYKFKCFAIKKQEIWERDLEYAAEYCRAQKRLFVMDGDALIMPMRHWEWLLGNFSRRLPWLERIATYANAKSVASKSDADLARLRELGLGMIYYGVESGHPEVLRNVRKGSSSEELVVQARRLKAAGFTLSVTVIVGLAGKEGSLAHAKATGEVLSAIDPEYTGALTLLIAPDTPLHEEAARGEFVLPDQMALLRELGEMIAHTNLTDGMFMANHASNYLPIKARLPFDKAATLERIQAALDGKIQLREDWMRGF